MYYRPLLSGFFGVACLALSACASSSIVQYPTADLTAHPVQIKTEVFKPNGSGPFPAVIVLHGCNGPSVHTQNWARRLVSWGYVAIIPDSFGSRGPSNICENTVAVLPTVRTFDIIGAAEFLNKQPYVAKDHIGLIGFSHGGWTIMKSVQAGNYLEALGVKGAVGYYPYCDPVTDKDVSIPLLVLIGDNDDWTPADRCKALQKSGLRRPELAEMIFYPNTYHGFDRPGPTEWVNGYSGSGVIPRRIEYNAESSADAEKRAREFFAKTIGR